MKIDNLFLLFFKITIQINTRVKYTKRNENEIYIRYYNKKRKKSNEQINSFLLCKYVFKIFNFMLNLIFKI